MRALPGALFRCFTWYIALYWSMTYLLGFPRIAAAVIAPVTIVGISYLSSWRFYHGLHRKKRDDHQAGVRGPGRGARACAAGHQPCYCTCPRCAGSRLTARQAKDLTARLGLGRTIVLIEDEDGALHEPGRLRLGWVADPPLAPGGMISANLAGAMTYVKNRYGRVSGKNMTLRLLTQQSPPGNSPPVVSGSGYTRSGSPTSWGATAMNQLPSWAIPGCGCPLCSPPNPASPHPPGCICANCSSLPVPGTGSCQCQQCQSFRVQARTWAAGPTPAYSPGGLIPSPPAPTASQPPVLRPRPSWSSRGMDGFDGADFVAGTVYGYRWWTLKPPPGVAAGLSPAESAGEWEPGMLRGVKDFWQPGVNQARCMPSGPGSGWHDESQVPDEDCGCGFWAYWEIQAHDMGSASSLPVVGVVKATGNVLMGPRGFRAGKAEIVAMYLPFHLDLLTPRVWPAGTSYLSPRRPQRQFTGEVISFPGAPPLPPSLGGPRPEPELLPPPPPGPTEEEIAEANAEANDRAEAWMAVIADRVQLMYPGAELCASLNLMKAKYPVTDEHAAEQTRQVALAMERQAAIEAEHRALANAQMQLPDVVPCPYCNDPIALGELHKHFNGKHIL